MSNPTRHWAYAACVLAGLLAGHLLTREWSRQPKSQAASSPLISATGGPHISLPPPGADVPSGPTTSSRPSGSPDGHPGLDPTPGDRADMTPGLPPDMPVDIDHSHVFNRHMPALSADEEATILRGLQSNPINLTVHFDRLALATNPNAVPALMNALDQFISEKNDKLPIFEVLLAMEGIYERTHRADISEYLQRRWYDLGTAAKKYFLIHYPFPQEIVQILRDGLVDPSDPNLHRVVGWRIGDTPEIWGQLQADVYRQASVEASPGIRKELEDLKAKMEGGK